ncbi:MAG: hypothetical protein ABIP48_20325 [Planctomycetota bacterium]
MTKSRLVVPVLIAGLFVWFFAEALFGGGVFVFRDAGHYYYPLFQLVKSEWTAGRVPLWNPYENLGAPLAGNPTSSVFYPGALVFLLPIDYAWAYKLYVMGHVLLAAAGAYRLGRHWGGSVEASGVGALSYAFSGNVLFQYTNVVFLVGAAWLPLAVLAADRMLVWGAGDGGQGPGGRGQGTGDRGQKAVSGRWAGMRAALLFGAVLALMTLGGSAEMAYHAGLIAAMYALWLWSYERKGSGFRVQGSESPPRPSPFLAHPSPLTPRPLRTWRPTLLFLAAVVGLVLSAVQVFPALELSRRSGRDASPVARSVYEVPKHLPSGDRGISRGLSQFSRDHAKHGAQNGTVPLRNPHWADGLTCRQLEPGTHHGHVYHFSVGPWRLAEYVWPNSTGRQFPVHRRWLAAVPAEGRIWVPSLYMGLFPLLLAIAALRLRRGDAQESWLSWLALLSVVASFGHYGLGWLAHEIQMAAGRDPSAPRLVGAPFGGLYWLLTVTLPGYVYFRYPAKLLVIATLALSMLAVRGWDRTFREPAPRPARGLLWLGGVSLAGALAVAALFPMRQRWLGHVAPDVLFGPLDTAGACLDLLFALLQTAVLCAAGWWLLHCAGRDSRKLGGTGVSPVCLCNHGQDARATQEFSYPKAIALVLIAVDLAVANGWMVACAPADEWQRQSKLATLLQEEQARRGDDQPYRVFRRPIWMPPSWSSSASPDRMAEAMRWDRDTLWPKHNLPAAVAVAEVQGTMKPYDYQVLLWVTKRHALKSGDAVPPATPMLEAMNPKYLILRANDRPHGMEPVALAGTEADGLEDVSLWHNPEHLPRAWIVHRVEVLPPMASRDPREIWRRTEQVFYPEGRRRDLRESAVVEADVKLIPISHQADTLRDSVPLLRRSSARRSSAALLALRQAVAHGGEKSGLNAVPAEAGGETCRVTRYDPLCVEIEARLAQPGLVVLADQHYPGWHLEVETAGQPSRTVPILRTNRVMRGAWLEAGRHRLTYRYRPPRFLWGAWLSGLGWIGLGAIGIATAIHRRQRTNSPGDAAPGRLDQC